VNADPVVRFLIEDAAAWRLLGLLLERPHGDWWSQVAALGAEVRDPDLQQAAQAAAGADPGDWLSALGPGGVTSGREVGHDGAVDPGHLLAELQAHYQAFHYRPRAEEPPDHVAVEAGFVGYLRLKEAYARAQGLADAAETTATATARFLDEHVSAWAQPLADALEETRLEHLRLGARAAFRRVGPPRRRRAPAPPSPDCAMTCGPAEPAGVD
jgi:nitrate reductase assembly molybdenum cofactor insertion protein NarJ